MWTTARGLALPHESAASRPVAPALAVWVWRTSGRRSPDDLAQREDRGRVGAERELALEHRQPQQRDAELVCDVLHRLLASGERAGDDDDVVPPPRLLARELEHVQRRPADVQARDHVHDPHGGSGLAVVGGASDGATAVIPIVIQKMAASGMPPKRAAPVSPPASAATQAAGR